MHTPAIEPPRPAGRPPHSALLQASHLGRQLLLASLVCALAPAASHAGLPEPNAIVYGSIALDGQPATAADTHLVIEARHAANGPVIATTTLGAEPAAGNFYVLRIPMESAIPLANPIAAVVGDTLLLRVVEAAVVVEETSFTLTARGQTQRVDLGTALPDSDADGLPDVWENAHFRALHHGPASVGLNGQTLLHNYIAGTNPNQEDDALAVLIESAGGLIFVSFTTRQAEGPGYEGLNRYYTLWASSDLEHGWEEVGGYIRLPGNNTDALYPQMSEGLPGFYRVQVWLE